MIKLILLILFVNQSLQFNHYKITLKPKEIRCFSDDVFKDTFVRLELKSDTPNITIEFQKPGEQKVSYINSNNFEQSFTSKEAGYLEFCLKSTYEGNIETEIDYSTGLEAKDFGGLIKENDLKPLDDKIKEIESKIRNFKTSYLHAETGESLYKSTSEELGSFISKWFYILTLIISIVGIIEILVVRRQLNSYKLK